MKPLTIVIAEDDADLYALIRKNLERICADAEIVRLQNGKELLDYFFDTEGDLNHERNGRHLLLLDIKMPIADGVAAVEKIKSDPELKKMTVFILTTTDNQGEINRCYHLGCNFYIVKPADRTEFMQTLEHLGTFLLIPGLIIPEINSSYVSNFN